MDDSHQISLLEEALKVLFPRTSHIPGENTTDKDSFEPLLDSHSLRQYHSPSFFGAPER